MNNYHQDIISNEDIKLKVRLAYYRSCMPLVNDPSHLNSFGGYRELERSTGIVMADSPTQHIIPEQLKKLNTFPHPNPRKRVHTTTSIEEVAEFGKTHPMLISWKLDGQPVSLLYHGGQLHRAVICEDDGIMGCDVTHAVKQMRYVPLKIPYHDMIEVLGIAAITWKDYEELSRNSLGSMVSPGKLARHSVRNLDAAITRKNHLEFVAYGMNSLIDLESKQALFARLEALGFKVVQHRSVIQGISSTQINQIRQVMNPLHCYYPATGLIFEHDIPTPVPIGDTGSHVIALTWADCIYRGKT